MLQQDPAALATAHRFPVEPLPVCKQTALVTASCGSGEETRTGVNGASAAALLVALCIALGRPKDVKPAII